MERAYTLASGGLSNALSKVFDKFFKTSSQKNRKIHLYDLENDPTEENNIVDKNPEMASKLRQEMRKILQSEK